MEAANCCVVPFVVTIVATTLFSTYMLFDPGDWLAHLMQLTDMSVNFKVFVLLLALGAFVCAWIAERRVFVWIGRLVGKLHCRLWPGRQKRRKEYKIVLKDMQM